MRIRARLVTAFLACGLIPMLIVSTLNIWNARTGCQEISKHATNDLRQKIEQHLTASRDFKKAQIVDYFGIIQDQVVTFSNDVMIVDAMRQFNAAFQNVLEERQVESSDVDQMRRELSQYYQNQFAVEYKSHNGGDDPKAHEPLGQLPDATITLQHSYISKNSNPLGSKHLLDAAEDGISYDQLHAKYHPSVRGFLDRFGYYDIFLVDDETGNIVYSVFKELDFATSLKDGPFATTNFARAFRDACQIDNAGEAVLVDFECYWPSYEAPASFIASPIFDGDERIGILIFQMPVDRINELMAQETGIGETGENLLVGSDSRQRCDSSREPEKYSLVQAFRGDEQIRIETESVKKASAGENGVEISTNYLGEEVVSAFTPIELLGLNWVVLSEVTTAEAFAAVAEIELATNVIQRSSIISGGVATLLAIVAVVTVALVITRSLIRPIDATVATLEDIAEGEGDLTQRLDENQVGELGDLARNFNRFVKRIHDVVHSIVGNASTLSQSSYRLNEVATKLSSGAMQSKTQSATVSSAAEELSINMQNMASSTQEISSGIDTVATAVDQMKTTISDIAKNSEQSAEVASQAAAVAELSNAKVGDLGEAADEIGKVTEVIQDIAEQTNLLALNATIEAARAGEAGKGFAVVATEVKELAKQTAAATEDIRQRIHGVQQITGDAVDSIEQISGVISQVNELSSMIASAVDAQSLTTQQISESVGGTVELARTVASGVSESAQATSEITRNICHVDHVLQETATGADQSRVSGEELSRLSCEMQELVKQFRVNAESSSDSV